MSSVTIQFHAAPSYDDRTATDKATIEAIRERYPVSLTLVGAHELAEVLRSTQPLWAKKLEREEEASMVTVRFD